MYITCLIKWAYFHLNQPHFVILFISLCLLYFDYLNLNLYIVIYFAFHHPMLLDHLQSNFGVFFSTFSTTSCLTMVVRVIGRLQRFYYYCLPCHCLLNALDFHFKIAEFYRSLNLCNNNFHSNLYV